MARDFRVRLFVVAGAAAFAGVAFWASTRALAAQVTYPSTPASTSSQTSTIDWSDQVPAHLAVVDGTGWLDRDGQSDAAMENMPLLSGDRVRTDRGRIEIRFADGSALDIDEYSSVTLISDSLLRFDAGRVHLSVARQSSPFEYRIDAAGTTTRLLVTGEYRVALELLDRTNPTVVAGVIRGSAEISTPYGFTMVRAGYEASAVAGRAPSQAVTASVASWAPFDRWADDRRDERLGGPSAQYLPPDLTTYSSDFDHYGAWQYDSSFGYVWYPRVDASWQPYYQGEWSDVGDYGYVWIGVGRWSWPTHHYGRWGQNGARWYWIPDAHWGPAWVSWAVAPGYLSWCPLGVNNRPVQALRGGYGSPSHAWTAVSVRNTGARIPVNSRSRATTLPSDAQFVERRGAPQRGGLGPSTAAPIRSIGAGTSQPRAVSREPERNPGDFSARAQSGESRIIAPRSTPSQPSSLDRRAGVRQPDSSADRVMGAPWVNGASVPREGVQGTQPRSPQLDGRGRSNGSAQPRAAGTESRTPLPPARMPTRGDERAPAAGRSSAGREPQTPSAPPPQAAPPPQRIEASRPSAPATSRAEPSPPPAPSPRSEAPHVESGRGSSPHSTPPPPSGQGHSAAPSRGR